MTMPSVGFGGPLTSLVILVCHNGLPLMSKASTSPLSVPTATATASAPTPAESGFPVLMRQRCVPFAGSTLTSTPSGEAA